jgi:O-methyltransferase domain
MSAEAMLLVLERMIGPPNEGADAKFADLNMLVEPGGPERTAEEFVNLFNAASFKLTRIIPAGTRTNLIEGVPF